MAWTIDQKLNALLRLPWTVTVERNEEEKYLVARVAELPDALGTGATEKELAADLWDALYTSLGARLDNNDPIPLPPGTELPWARDREPRRSVRINLRGEAWPEARTSAGSTQTVDLQPA